MARIRTIKPEFPQSESMGRVSRESRLLFIQLWTICDDSGITRGSSRILASLLYPYDADAFERIDEWLNELEREECVVRYVIDGSTYLQVLTWKAHQKIDKPTPSKLPQFEESSRLVANPREEVASPRGGIGMEGKGVDQEGKGPVLALTRHAQLAPSRKNGTSEEPPEFAELQAAYPKRSGGQRWPDALTACRKHVAVGATWQQLIDAAKRYALFLEATGKSGTEYVQQAATFYGRGAGWREAWVVNLRPHAKTVDELEAEERARVRS